MDSQKNEFVKRYKLDIIVIAAILVISLSVLFIVLLTKKDGATVSVEINGEETAVYSLEVDGVYPLNGGTNVLVIENGEAYLNYSNCPDHTCERTGKISHVGETIICLPNRISITIKGDAADGVDLVS